MGFVMVAIAVVVAWKLANNQREQGEFLAVERDNKDDYCCCGVTLPSCSFASSSSGSIFWR